MGEQSKGYLIKPQPSPLTDTWEEQKVIMPMRGSRCSRLRQQHGNGGCKRAGLSTTVDIGKRQGGRVRVRVSRTLWAIQLEVAQNVGFGKSKFYKSFIPILSIIIKV